MLFTSSLTLRFIDKAVEEQYKDLVYEKLKRFNKLFAFIHLIIHVMVSCMIYSEYEIWNNSYSYVLVFSVSTSLLIMKIPCFFVLYFCNLDYKTHKALCYFYVITIYFTFSFFRYYMFDLMNVDVTFFYALLFCEISLRIFIIYFGLIGLVETVILTFSIICLFVMFQTIIYARWTIFPNYFILYLILIAIKCLFAYFMVREKRTSFYLNFLLKKNIKWYENIFDKSNFGFLQISDNKIIFANRLMKGNLFNLEHSSDGRMNIPIETNLDLIHNVKLNENYSRLVCDLFDGMESNIFNPVLEVDEVRSDEASQAAKLFQRLKENYTTLQDDNFIFLGLKMVSIKAGMTSNHNDDNTFEILYRYYNNGRDNFEFIFNDITRTREEEKKNAEFKYKALYLAKVAHEFKNPLICISEVVEKCNDISTQIKENVDNELALKECMDKLEENLFLVNSFSKYLIILTKDLDYFSNEDNEYYNKLIISESNLGEILKFVSEITRGLLIRSNKQDKVKFILNKEEDVNNIIEVDEIKLKQVLINLCSNAVKFTYKGKINLTVSKRDEAISFTVEDTGVGISEERQASLFKPFTKDEDSKNLLGTGLGLTIVSNITRKFGNIIQFSSKQGEGSKFWFTIPLDMRQVSNQREKEKGMVQCLSPKRLRLPLNRSSINISETSFNTVVREDIVLNIDYNKEEILGLFSSQETREYNIIIVDDDKFVRNSSARNLSKAARLKGIKLNITEADDGLGTLYHVAEFNKAGRALHLIVSDETMVYMGGSESWSILKQLIKSDKIMPMEFVIVTAYDTSNFEGFDGVYSKPLSLDMASKILMKLK